MSINFEGSSEWCTALRLANTLQIFLRKCTFWCVTTTYINDEMMTVMWYKRKVILKIVSSWWVGHISASARGFRDTLKSRESQLSVSTDTMMSSLRSLWVQLTLHSQMHCSVTWHREDLSQTNKHTNQMQCFIVHIISWLNGIVHRMLNCSDIIMIL